MINLINNLNSNVNSLNDIFIKDDQSYLMLLDIKELELIKDKLPIDSKIMSEFYKTGTSKFESHYGFDYIKLIIPNAEDINEEFNKIFIYFDNNLLIFISDNHDVLNKIRDGFQAAQLTTVTLEKILFSFFEKATSEDSSKLENIEQDISNLEESLITLKKNNNYINEIIALRKKLLTLKRYYEQLINIAESIEENENDLISEKELKYFKMLTNRFNRLFNSVLNLRDYVTQVREAYQAQVDIDQNNLMKIFTLITTIFFPLTLIVGWYGMNFSMPEYGWAFGYPLVIALSISIVGICMFLFKKKKWL